MKPGAILSVLLLLLLSSPAGAMPPPRWNGVAINQASGLCSVHSDVFTLPEGWIGYWPESAFAEARTPYGTCRVAYKASFAECCAQLGLETIPHEAVPFNEGDVYIDPRKHLGIANPTGPYTCAPATVPVMVGYGAVSIHNLTRQCTAALAYRLKRPHTNGAILSVTDDENQCLLDKGWERYDGTVVTATRTPLGDCEEGLMPQRCCQKLGLTFIPTIPGATSGSNPPTFFISGEAWNLSVLLSALALFAALVAAHRKR